MNKDAKLIFEAYQQAKPSIKESTGPKTVDQINAEINATFQQAGVQPQGAGGEAFWLAVEDVLHIDRASGKRLQILAKEWEEAFKRENIVKPHLQPPVVESSNEVHVPRDWEKKQKRAPQTRTKKGVNIFYVNKIVKHVEKYLADAVSEGGDEKENCWTLAIDQAHALNLQGQDAINTAHAACRELGY